MASSDLRDVLNLPTDGHPRPSKKQKTSAARPNLKGLAREVQNLGGDNPIAIVPEVAVFKKRRFASRKPAAKWELRAFMNSARGDDGKLVMRHWRRKTEGEDGAVPVAEIQDAEMADAVESQPADLKTEDSAYAKYNVQVDLPQYNDDQYETNLKSGDWSKEETDYLLGLLMDFDLRWPLVWDRYDYVPEAINGEASLDGDESKAIIPVPTPRTMEDLKARYYEVAAKMMAVQKPVQYMTQPEYALHELMAKFNPVQEKMRKEFATNALTRSKEEAKEEESLLLEIKRILARSDRFNEERRELYNRLDYPHTDQDISAFKSSAGLQTLLHNLMNVDKSKKRKSLVGADGVSPSGPVPQSATQETHRRESIAASASGHGNHRESISSIAQTPTTAGNKKGGLPQERKKLSEAEMFVYGVSNHDRLTSGPTFRYEKINKMFTHKSNQQQMRITNTLNELDIPPRLTMPTAAVTAQFELLLGAVNSLLDARKVTDKIEAEIKLEQAKKADREKTLDPNSDPSSTAKNGTAGSQSAADKSDTANGSGAANTGDQNQAEAGGEEEEEEEDEEEDDDDDAQPTAKGEQNSKALAVPKEDNAEAESNKGLQPGSSGVSHKRSASVLSAVSDKSAKRQKK